MNNQCFHLAGCQRRADSGDMTSRSPTAITDCSCLRVLSLQLSRRSVLYWVQTFSSRNYRVSTPAGILVWLLRRIRLSSRHNGKFLTRIPRASAITNTPATVASLPELGNEMHYHANEDASNSQHAKHGQHVDQRKSALFSHLNSTPGDHAAYRRRGRKR